MQINAKIIALAVYFQVELRKQISRYFSIQPRRGQEDRAHQGHPTDWGFMIRVAAGPTGTKAHISFDELDIITISKISSALVPSPKKNRGKSANMLMRIFRYGELSEI